MTRGAHLDEGDRDPPETTRVSAISSPDVTGAHDQGRGDRAGVEQFPQPGWASLQRPHG